MATYSSKIPSPLSSIHRIENLRDPPKIIHHPQSQTVVVLQVAWSTATTCRPVTGLAMSRVRFSHPDQLDRLDDHLDCLDDHLDCLDDHLDRLDDHLDRLYDHQ